MRVQRCGSFAYSRWRSPRMTPYSSESLFGSNAGTRPAFSNSTPLCTNSVASPPSSRRRLGPEPSGHMSACSVHHQYSSSVSPFHANTATPFGLSTVPCLPTATAAAAWSCVLGADGHEPGHLLLGKADLLAAEVGEREVGDLECWAVEGTQSGGALGG